MPLGPAIKKILGVRLAAHAAGAYRSVFIDLDRVAEALDPHLPRGAKVLDLGGGSGAPLAALLRRRPDLSATLIDIAAEVGTELPPSMRDRVRVHAATDLRRFRSLAEQPHQAVLVSDVLHHVPVDARAAFLREVRALLFDGRGGVLIIKEVEPRGVRAWLGLMSDRYVSGDRGTSFLSRSELADLITRTIGPCSVTETRLFNLDPPNYALAVTFP